MQGISDLVMLPGLINLDFADVRTTMIESGDAILGIGMGIGEHRAVLAAEKAVASPLLETSVDGAQSLLLSITGGPDLSLIEASEAARVVQEAAHPDANIIFGASIDEDLDEQVWVTVIATRFDSPFTHRPARAPIAEPREPRNGGGARSTRSKSDRYADPASGLARRATAGPAQPHERRARPRRARVHPRSLTARTAATPLTTSARPRRARVMPGQPR